MTDRITSEEYIQALHDVHSLAIDKQQTVATAESLTGGLIAAALTSLSDSSRYFKGGIVAYDIDAKVRLLHVSRIKAARCYCVSAKIARAMAIGAIEQFDSTCSIAVTGYAEPWSKGDDTYKAFAHYAVCCYGRWTAGRIDLDGLGRNEARQAVVRQTICVLAGRLKLL
jgi:PncC family amidohydrolase